MNYYIFIAARLRLFYGISIYLLLAIATIFVYLHYRVKKTKIIKKMTEEDSWMDSLDDTEWDCGEDKEI